MIQVTKYIVILSSCAIVLGNQIISCASNDYVYTTCELNDNYNTIVKTEQHSGSPCTMDESFGLSGTFIWVSRGCRATFLVTNTASTTTKPMTTTTTTSTTSLTTTSTSLLISTTTTVPYTITRPTTTALTVETISAVHSHTITPGAVSSSDIVYITTASHTTSSSNHIPQNGFCSCNCTIAMDNENLAMVIKELRRKLTVNKSLLSSTIRKKISASDPRPSAAVIGYTGLVFLIAFILLIMISDLIALFQYLSAKRRPLDSYPV